MLVNIKKSKHWHQILSSSVGKAVGQRSRDEMLHVGGCSSPGKDHWYLALKRGGKNLRVRVRIKVRARVRVRA